MKKRLRAAYQIISEAVIFTGIAIFGGVQVLFAGWLFYWVLRTAWLFLRSI